MKKKSTLKTSSKTTARNMEQRFVQGKDVLDYFDTENTVQRVNVDFPSWVIKALDKESKRMGIARQALIKFWIVDHLKKAG